MLGVLSPLPHPPIVPPPLGSLSLRRRGVSDSARARSLERAGPPHHCYPMLRSMLRLLQPVGIPPELAVACFSEAADPAISLAGAVAWMPQSLHRTRRIKRSGGRMAGGRTGATGPFLARSGRVLRATARLGALHASHWIRRVWCLSRSSHPRFTARTLLADWRSVWRSDTRRGPPKGHAEGPRRVQFRGYARADSNRRPLAPEDSDCARGGGRDREGRDGSGLRLGGCGCGAGCSGDPRAVRLAVNERGPLPVPRRSRPSMQRRESARPAWPASTVLGHRRSAPLKG